VPSPNSDSAVAPLTGGGITVFVEVRLKVQNEERGETFEKEIERWPEVVECFLMTGDADYLLRVVADDVKSYHRFLDGSLRKIKSVRTTKSSVAMRQVKYAGAPQRANGHNLRLRRLQKESAD
jgi:DNA-binding Lrp family transcriptional regulator